LSINSEQFHATGLSAIAIERIAKDTKKENAKIIPCASSCENIV
jgi:hypothetical protein